MFNKGDVVVAKNEYLGKNETLQDTIGVVISYNSDNDYLVLGVLHPENYAIAPTFSMRGEFYRPVTKQECTSWNIV